MNWLISLGSCRDGCNLAEDNLSGAPQIAALSTICEARNFHDDAIRFFAQGGWGYRVVRGGRCNPGEIDDTTRHRRIAIPQAEGGRATNLEPVIDRFADHSRDQRRCAIKQPHQILTALNLFSWRCQ